MSTSRSSPSKIKRQSDKIAAQLKAAERGEITYPKGAREREITNVGIVMDDKLIRIDISWATIKEYSAEALSAYIAALMQGGATRQ